MRVKAAAQIIITGFIIAIFSSFIAIAAIDAPHNASNNISCGSCHGAALLNSPFWGGSYSPYDIDDTVYNKLCLNCHRSLSGPYTETNAPLEKPHSSIGLSNKYGDWSTECRNCHDPHYQKQKNYKNTDAGKLYLATGTITSYDSYDSVHNTTILHYSSITYKSGWNSTKLTKKTEDYRRTILFPNANKLGYNYPVIAVDTPTANTITVTGDATVYLYPPTTFVVLYGQYIKDTMSVGGTNVAVKFFDQTDSDSYADGDTAYNGICEVCHTQTKHFRNNGGGPDQDHSNLCSGEKDKTNCITCHNHKDSLGHGYKNNCVNCHGHDDGWDAGTYYGTTQSHSTHTENDADDLKGPNITCGDCHDTNKFPYFKSGTDSDGDGEYSRSETNECNNCHSPNGSYNGVNDAVIGAENNWCQGVYQGNALKSGKEKWCAGCHDNVPSVVNTKTASDIAGDNSTYGYYLDTHGNGTYGVSRKNVAYSKGECLHCHDVSQSGHGGKLFDTSNNFCFKCHDNTTTYATAPIKNRSYSYRAGGYTSDAVNNSILYAFSLASSHKLSSIKTFINGKWGYDVNSNPCTACHNPHIVQGDPANSPDATKNASSRSWLVSRPSQHATNYTNIWGDSAGEKMRDYTAKYQAPYRYNSTTAYEPDGSTTDDGSNLFDSVSFCLDCHTNINWGTDGDIHGKATQTGGYICDEGDKKDPYPANPDPTPYPNRVLSCLDCHEPHGSPNEHMLRSEVNGTEIPVITQTGRWWYFCRACHKSLATKHFGGIPNINSSSECEGCHFHGFVDYPCHNLSACSCFNSYVGVKTF